jgi:hypothetical protein
LKVKRQIFNIFERNCGLNSNKKFNLNSGEEQSLQNNNYADGGSKTSSFWFITPQDKVKTSN